MSVMGRYYTTNLGTYSIDPNCSLNRLVPSMGCTPHMSIVPEFQAVTLSGGALSLTWSTD